MKKLLPYILILIIVLSGFFGLVKKTQAAKVVCVPSLTNNPDGREFRTNIPDPGSAVHAQQACADHKDPNSFVVLSWELVQTGTTLTPAPAPVSTSSNYTLLAPLPCKDGDAGCENVNGKWQLTTFDQTGVGGDTNSGALGSYLNLMINIFIGLCAVLAVIMIVMGGIEYMTSELVSSKAAGKERITNAIFGLILALGAWTILNQINPHLLDTDLKSLTDVVVNVTAEDFALSPSTYIVPIGKTGQASGTNCDENEVSTSNQTANASLSNAQIHTLACIGGIESGCKKLGATNYNWGKGSSAYGPFQITLQGNADCFESNVCRQAAEVSGPLNCATGFRNGNPIPGSLIVEQCKKAANNFTCSVSAAACLIKKKPNYSDWNMNPNLSKCK